jgi:hypothetical protein
MAEPLIQLESWESALKSGLISARRGKSSEPIDIAKLSLEPRRASSA